jgi:hypothetical protein
VYRLGYKSEDASNVETAGAVQVTQGTVFIKGSAVNFTQNGDTVCCQVQVGRVWPMVDHVYHHYAGLHVLRSYENYMQQG